MGPAYRLQDGSVDIDGAIFQCLCGQPRQENAVMCARCQDLSDAHDRQEMRQASGVRTKGSTRMGRQRMRGMC